MDYQDFKRVQDNMDQRACDRWFVEFGELKRGTDFRRLYDQMVNFRVPVGAILLIKSELATRCLSLPKEKMSLSYPKAKMYEELGMPEEDHFFGHTATIQMVRCLLADKVEIEKKELDAKREEVEKKRQEDAQKEAQKVAEKEKEFHNRSRQFDEMVGLVVRPLKKKEK
jgi:hypothetical protein